MAGAAHRFAVNGHRPQARHPAVRLAAHGPRTWSRWSASSLCRVRRNADSDGTLSPAPSPADSCGGRSAAHCAIAVNDLAPAITAHTDSANSPAARQHPTPVTGINHRGQGRDQQLSWSTTGWMGEDVAAGMVPLLDLDGVNNLHDQLEDHARTATPAPRRVPTRNRSSRI